MLAPRARIPQLDGLRAVAITSVFIHHVLKVKLLWMGVDLFFVLSGFLITGILFNEKSKAFGSFIGNFYLRRAKRILPAYLVVLVISALVFGSGWLHYWYFYVGGMNFLRPMGLPSLETLPLWSLAVEEQFYLLWPIAVFTLSRRQLIWCASAMLVAAPLLRFFCTPLFHLHWAIYMLVPFRMDTLAAGALIALIWPDILEKLESGRQRRRLQVGVLIAGALASVAGLLALRWLSSHGHTTSANTRMGNFGVYEAALVIVTSIFIVALLGWGKRVLTLWPMMWIGRISYSIYLFHLTANSLVARWGWIAVASLTVVYAVGMWHLVENPVNSIGHSKPRVLVTQT